jgi:hypothetical protein
VRQGAIESAALLPSFEQGAVHFSRLSGVPMSDTTLHDLMQTYGQRQVAHEAAAAHEAASAPVRGVSGPGPHAPQPPAQVALSQDGTTILTYDGWKEVKLSSISLFEVCAAAKPGKPTEVRLTQHSYCAGLWGHETVNEHFWWDMERRRADRSPCQVAVADAAPWIWENVALAVPKAHEVIDWWHAVDYFWRVAKAVFGEGTPEAAAWMETTKTHLWDGALDKLRGVLGDLQPTSDAGKTAVRCALAYLAEHDKRLQYPAFRVAGYPLGSGSVESGCKTLVGGRMKHGGQRWKESGANAVLAVRSALFSDRWLDAWSSIYWPNAQNPTTS